MNGDTIRTITIRGQSEGLDKLTADVNKLAAAQENVAVVSEQSAKRTLSLEDAWKRQTLRLDEAARAQANIARETKLADAALKEGLATQAQHAQRLELINQRYAKTADATKVVTHQTGLARHELVNLGRQAQDVGVSLMSGQSPFTVLVQQGTQIADVFATSGGTVRGFFSQAAGWAKTFLTSTTGIVTAVLAVGAAAVYVASQFVSAGKTMEQVLEEHNRLLKEGKKLLDERTSVQEKMFAQGKGLTAFQAERSRLETENKLREAQEKAAEAGRRASTRPTQVGGEMGEAPTGVAPLGPGYDKIAAAAERLNTAMAAGLPGLKEYQETLGQVGKAHPELARVVEEMLKIGQAGDAAQRAAIEARALDDALKGIATNAQLAALGFASIAQFNLANTGAKEAADALERMAVKTLEIAAAYPGMSIEVAKQLDALQGQLTVAQARTAAEAMVTQEYVTQNQLLAQGKTLEEAAAIAAGQRAIAEANVSKQIADQIHGLEDQVKQIKAAGTGMEDLIDGEIAYSNALRQGATEADALALKKATNATTDARNYNRTAADMAKIDEQQGAIADAIEGSTENMNRFADATGNAASYMRSLAFWAETMEESIGGRLSELTPQFKESGGGTFQIGPGGWIQDFVDTIDARNRALGYDKSKYDDDPFDTLSDSLNKNTASTDSLNATMQDALSPYYSQDPRTTKLGFRAGVSGNPDWMTGATNANPLVAVLGAGATAPGMATGGSFTVGGGYSANDNAMAVFPVASGEEVVVNRTKQPGGQVVNIDNRIVINGSVDQDTLSQMKVSRYQQAQRMRAGMAQG